MTFKKDVLIKISIISLLFIYVYFYPLSDLSNKIDAAFVLFFSILLIYKGRKNLPLTIMFIFIFYVNYSVVIGEYFVGENLSVPFTEIKTMDIYGISIRILLIFMAIVALFYNSNYKKTKIIKLNKTNNQLIFWLIIIALALSFLFGVERGYISSYSVRINPIFEYSKILFLFAFYFSGKFKYKKILISLLIVVFILQDVYFGGRITSMQLSIFFAITILVEKLSFNKIIGFAVLGVIFNNLVSVYRSNYNIIGINLISIVKNMFSNYFVFDTATYAYYASATHVAASQKALTSIRLQSAWEFFKSIFGLTKSPLSEVTSLVSNDYFYNIGGGFLPTHFYFWFGWVGVFFIASFLVLLINNLTNKSSDYSRLLLFGIIINTPRWYLYSPSQLFRGALLIVSILYVLSMVGSEITSKKKRPNKLMFPKI